MTRYHATVEEKWAANTQAAEDGHLLWTGTLNSHSGTPVIDLRGKRYQAARVAFQIHHGREPAGVVRVSCGVPLCVAPEHLTDTRARQNERALLRILDGRSTQTNGCTAGHDQAIHGRFRDNGKPYCTACNHARSHVKRDRKVTA